MQLCVYNLSICCSSVEVRFAVLMPSISNAKRTTTSVALAKNSAVSAAHLLVSYHTIRIQLLADTQRSLDAAPSTTCGLMARKPEANPVIIDKPNTTAAVHIYTDSGKYRAGLRHHSSSSAEPASGR